MAVFKVLFTLLLMFNTNVTQNDRSNEERENGKVKERNHEREKQGESNNRKECSVFPNDDDNNITSTKFQEVMLQSLISLEFGILQKKKSFFQAKWEIRGLYFHRTMVELDTRDQILLVRSCNEYKEITSVMTVIHFPTQLTKKRKLYNRKEYLH